jgi:hypothetical protein
MVYERFTKQLDGCTYCSGGLNCTCACHSMWEYRASQGRISRTACAVRIETGDKSGGTNLGQMQELATARGIPSTLWRPGSFDSLRKLLQTGRYGAHLNGGYSALADTAWDCFEGNFRGNHDIYLSAGGANNVREGDPGADERRGDIPAGYQSMPWDLAEKFAGRLNVGSATSPVSLNTKYGTGKVYALITPADPIVSATRYVVSITGDAEHRTNLYASPGGAYVGAVTKATYICTRAKVGGLWWYRIVGTVTGAPTANRGRYFKPTRYTTARYA